MTAELGPGFYAFEGNYERSFGVDKVGVKSVPDKR